MAVKSYTLARDAETCEAAKKGTVVYDCLEAHYGLVGDDNRATGIEHAFVTLEPDGSAPGFTVPVRDLLPNHQIQEIKARLVSAEAFVEDLKKKLQAKDDLLDKAAAMMTAARQKIETARAILHLIHTDHTALSNNAMPRVHQALTEAHDGLQKGEVDLDRIPF